MITSAWRRVFTVPAGGWLATLLLCLVGLAYCLDALRSPFFGGLDTLSNLLPIIHYRHAILDQGTWPWYTTLWYGGRYQWMNPLWSFLYLPATIVWIALPLDLAAKVVISGHVIFSLLAGRHLAQSFLPRTDQQIFATIFLTAPLASAVQAGHLEKVMSWPWVLLGLSFLFDDTERRFRHGLFAGLCLGIIPLTGSNYYALYTSILFGALLLPQFNRRLLLGFLLGASVGLFHLPSILYLVGVQRGGPAWSIPRYSSSPAEMFSDLFVGLGAVGRWESQAIIGLPTLIVLLASFYYFVCRPVAVPDGTTADRGTGIALMAAGMVFGLLITGLAYRQHHLLDTFRVPSRATPFLALTILLFILLSYRCWLPASARKGITVLLALSLLHVVAVTWQVRVPGDPYWLHNSGADELAAYLRQRGAQSVWTNTSYSNVLLNVALNLEEIHLPHVYYGDMGQTVQVQGTYCGGYTFDHVIAAGGDRPAGNIAIRQGREREPLVLIPAARVVYLDSFQVAGEAWDIYQIRCDIP